MYVWLHAVNGTNIVRPGGAVRYKFKVKNGLTVVPTGSTLLFTSDNSDVTLTNSSCTYSGAQVPTTTHDNQHPITDSTQLVAGSEYTCTVDVIVSTTHAASAKVPSFSIIAEYKGTGVTRAFYIESKTPPTLEVPVYTGASLAQPTTEVVELQDMYFVPGISCYGCKLVVGISPLSQACWASHTPLQHYCCKQQKNILEAACRLKLTVQGTHAHD